MSLRIYAIAYLVFLYAPIVLLPIFAFNDATIIRFPLAAFTTDWFGELMTKRSLHTAVKNSLLASRPSRTERCNRVRSLTSAAFPPSSIVWACCPASIR